MTDRENCPSVGRRRGGDLMPVSSNMCPSLQESYDAYLLEHDLKFPS